MFDPEASGCQVIIVDDNNAVLKTVANLFARFGYAVREARCGNDALDLFRRARSDLILSDLEMPDISGYALAGRIKQLDARTKVVIMTGSGQAPTAGFPRSQKIDGWLSKPFDLNRLGDLMNALGLPNAFGKRTPLRRALQKR